MSAVTKKCFDYSTSNTTYYLFDFICSTLMNGDDLKFYLTWLKDQLKASNNEYIQSVARCMQMMLRIDQYRIAFVSLDGIGAIVTVLSGKVNFQIQYQLSFCLWVMTFNTVIAEKLNK